MSDAGLCEREHLGKLIVTERMALGSALDFYETPGVVHDHVHICFGFRVFRVVEIEYCSAAINTDRNGGDLTQQRIFPDTLP